MLQDYYMDSCRVRLVQVSDLTLISYPWKRLFVLMGILHDLNFFFFLALMECVLVSLGYLYLSI